MWKSTLTNWNAEVFWGISRRSMTELESYQKIKVTNWISLRMKGQGTMAIENMPKIGATSKFKIQKCSIMELNMWASSFLWYQVLRAHISYATPSLFNVDRWKLLSFRSRTLRNIQNVINRPNLPALISTFHSADVNSVSPELHKVGNSLSWYSSNFRSNLLTHLF